MGSYGLDATRFMLGGFPLVAPGLGATCFMLVVVLCAPAVWRHYLTLRFAN